MLTERLTFLPVSEARTNNMMYIVLMLHIMRQRVNTYRLLYSIFHIIPFISSRS
jgi:hypothetical protein